MKHTLLCLFFIAIVGVLNAQIAQPDVYDTSKTKLSVQPLVHASLIFNWDGKSIYVDPSRIENLGYELPKADVVFITDIHGDHLNIKTLLQVITPQTIIVLPPAAQLKLKSTELPNKLIVIRNGETQKVLGIKVKALPMYNLPEKSTSRHIKGRGNGYVLNFGGLRVYISGDTSDIKEMRALKNIDMAFICMNLPYTMTVDKAASAVLDFKPKIVYPFHYRGKGGLSDVNKFKSLIYKDNKEIIVILKNWYPKR